MITTSLYQSGDGWLHRIDPRVKLAFTLAVMLIGLIYQNLWVLITLAATVLALFASAGLSGRRLWYTTLALLPVSVLMLVLRWIFYPQGDLLISVGPVQLTLGGLASGAVVAMRILVLALAVLLWLGTTSNQEVVRSLVALGFPFSWGLSMALALRFLPSFFSSYRSIEQAQRARGLDYRGSPLLQQVKLRQPILIAMIISSLRRSEQLAVALEARAYSPDHRRSEHQPLIMTPRDWLLLVFILVVSSLLVSINLLLAIGKQPL